MVFDENSVSEISAGLMIKEKCFRSVHKLEA